ncbi:Kinesin-like protein K39 [Diplonema papillatum]|nr:Kinesin-like protein K39 [Diplonema papillatum]
MTKEGGTMDSSVNTRKVSHTPQAMQAPLGVRDKDGTTIPLSGDVVPRFYNVYLRIRPYSPAELEECKKAGIDPTRSALELDAAGDKIMIEDLPTISLKKPVLGPPKRQWGPPSLFTKMLWSFGKTPKKWDDDIEHTYCDQRTVYESVTQQEDMVKKAYEGFSQCVVAFGGVGTGKSYTAIGEVSDPGLAPRLLTSIFNSRRTRVRAKVGEKIQVQICLTLLRVWKEQVEDVTSAVVDPNKKEGAAVRLTGEGDMLGTEPFVIETDNHLQEAISRVHRLGKRRERRSHAVVHLEIRQISTFAADEAEHSTEATRASTVTVVDIGAGNRHETESQNDGKFITKSRTTLARVIDLLRNKSDLEIATEKVDESYGSGSRVVVPKVPFKESKLTQLLSEQFGGSCMTSFVCNVSPFHKHTPDNSITIDLGRAAAKIRNKCYRREAKDLGRLRKINQEKSDMKKHIDEVNENVQIVQKYLHQRQNTINVEKIENARLQDVLARLREAIAREKEFRAQSAEALRAVQKMSSNASNSELDARLKAALAEQNKAKKEIATCKSRLMELETVSGDRTMEEVAKEIDEAAVVAAAERKVLAEAIQAEAKAILHLTNATHEERSASPNTWDVGDVVELKSGGIWRSGTIKEIDEDTGAFVVTGSDGAGGKFAETVPATEASRRLKPPHTSPSTHVGDSFESTRSGAGLLAQVHHSSSMHGADAPVLKAFLAEEMEIARIRLSRDISPSVCASKTPPQPLTPGLQKASSELLTSLLTAARKTLRANSKEIGLGFKLGCDGIEEKLRPRLQELEERERSVAAREADLHQQGAWPPSEPLTRLASVTPVISNDALELCRDVLLVSKERLTLVVDYVTYRSAMEDAASDWEEVIAASVAEAQAAAAKAEDARVKAGLREQEARDLKKEIDECETQLRSNAERTAAAQRQKEAKQLEFKKAQEGCCVVL